MTPATYNRGGVDKKGNGNGYNDDFDHDDEDDDDDLGISPPKTMQFHIPQSRLMKTPGEFVRYTCTM